MSLYVEDVDDLRDWWDGEREGDSSGSMLGRLDGVVAQIVARHVAEARVAALEEAARAIEAPWLAAPNPSPEMRLFTHAHAGIVRNLAATPPP